MTIVPIMTIMIHKKVNKLFKTILIILIAVFGAGFLGIPISADAEIVNLEITPDPIFSVDNFLPGDTISQTITIYNDSGKDYVSIILTANSTGTTSLASVLELETGEASIGLDELLNGGVIGISNVGINDGEEKNFDLAMYFKEQGNEDNNYQGKSVNFNFEFIFLGENGEENDENVGGGGGAFLPGLTIRGAKSKVATTTVIIEWDTNYFSTSEVIYGTSEGQFDLNKGPLKYGYEFYEEGNVDKKVTHHTVVLNDLNFGTTYHYRCVSHASPATIGKEYSFTTLAIASEEEGPIPTPSPTPPSPAPGPSPSPGPSPEPGPGPEPAPGPTPGPGPSPGPTPPAPVSPPAIDTGIGDIGFGANMVAAIGSIMSSKFLFGFSIFLLVMLFILLLKEGRTRYLNIRRKKGKRY